MSILQILRRLLWKEFREDRAIVLFTFLMPMSFFLAHQQKQANMRDIFLVSAFLLVYLMLILWAAAKGDSEGNGCRFSMKHLPINPSVRWFTSMLVSALIVVLLGAWFGFCTTFISGFDNAAAITAGLIDFLATYALCYYLASAFSKWLSIAIGILHVVTGGSLISAYGLYVCRAVDAVVLIVLLAVGAFAASYVFVWLANKKSIQARQGISIIVLLVILILPSYKKFNIYGVFFRSESNASVSVVTCSALDNYNQIYHSDRVLFYRNYQTGKQAEHVFADSTVHIGTYGGSTVYLFQHLPNSKTAQIIRWNTDRNETQTVCKLPVRRKLETLFISKDTIDTLGRFALFQTKAIWGEGQDLWLVDLNKGKAVLIFPCSEGIKIRQIGWSEKYATVLEEHVGLPYNMTPIRIDLKTMKTERLTPLNKRNQI